MSEDNHIPSPQMAGEDPLHWRVPSGTDADVTYDVFLAESNGVGLCFCRGFQITCVKQMKEKPGLVARCTHIRQARNAMRAKMFGARDPLDIIIEMIKKNQPNE